MARRICSLDPDRLLYDISPVRLFRMLNASFQHKLSQSISVYTVLKLTNDVSRSCRSFWHDSPHGPLARYVKLQVVHTPGMPGTFSPPLRVSNPDMYHGTCATHVPWCMPGSLTSGFVWRRWRGKCSRHSRRMRNPQIYVSGKRPMGMG